MPEVVLYDLPSKPPCRCWSLNPWKTRLLLNFKGIDYKTEWIEYPDIAPKFKELGLEPNPLPGTTPYTIPAIVVDGQPIMDSRKIAEVLEKKYPNPSLHMDDPILAQFEQQWRKFVPPSGGIFVPKVARNILNPESFEYFKRTREASFGKSLDQVEEEAESEENWKKITELGKQVAPIFHQNEGPFALGHTISYVDFYVAGFMQFMKAAGGDRLYEKMAQIDPFFDQVYQGCKPYLERDNH